MKPDHAWIAARIPHHGSMCLLDGVDDWSETSIRCHASSHLHTDNPLRANGRLGIANGIEYAAQAMAVHGALLAGTDTAPSAGYLTSVREVLWHTNALDAFGETLSIVAERLSGNDINILYSFSVEAGEKQILSGRASVMLSAAQAR